LRENPYFTEGWRHEQLRGMSCCPPAWGRRLPQFKWADEALAHEFSFERTRAGLGARSFGFHGMFNWPLVLTDAQIEARILRATGYVLKSQHCGEMRAPLAARQSGRAA
jgi:hypothetical protein